MADGVALDLGWLPVFREHDRSDHPNRSLSGMSRRGQAHRNAAYDGVMRDLKGTGFADMLLFTEHLVVNEYFVVDSLALKARLGLIPSVLEPYVQRRDPPIAVYEAAAAAVRDLSRSLWESADQSSALAQLLDEMNADGPSDFWSGPDKQLHDYMERSGDSLRMVASAASTATPLS